MWNPRRLAVAGLLCVVAMLVAACGSSSGGGSSTAAQGKAGGKTYKIGFTQIIPDPELDLTARGVQDGLARIGRARGVAFDVNVKNAQGDLATGTTIANQFVQDGVDLIVGNGTPVIVAAAKVTRTVPIVAAGMTFPVGAGVARSLDAPGGNVTGTTDYVDPARNIAVIKQVLPNVRKVGTILNLSEANSASWERGFKAAAQAAGIEPVVVGISNTGDVQSAAVSMADRVDAILIGADNTAVSATGTIVKAANDAKKPVFSVVAAATRDGALVGMGQDPYRMGLLTADVVAQVLLDGKSPATIPFRGLPDLQVTTNPQVAKRLGITLPASLGSGG